MVETPTGCVCTGEVIIGWKGINIKFTPVGSHAGDSGVEERKGNGSRVKNQESRVKG